MSRRLVRSHDLFLNIFFRPLFLLFIRYSFLYYINYLLYKSHNIYIIFSLSKNTNLSILPMVIFCPKKKKDTSYDVSFQEIIYYEAKRYLKSDTIRSQIIFS